MAIIGINDTSGMQLALKLLSGKGNEKVLLSTSECMSSMSTLTSLALSKEHRFMEPCMPDISQISGINSGLKFGAKVATGYTSFCFQGTRSTQECSMA